MASQSPDFAKRLAALERKLEELERIVRRGKAPANLRDLNDADVAKAIGGATPLYNTQTGRWEPAFTPSKFSLPTVAVSSSGRWYAPAPVHLGRMDASLDVASPSGSTIVQLRKNGVAISGASIGFMSGATGLISIDISADFLAGDYLTAAVTLAGAGAKGLVVQPKAG